MARTRKNRPQAQREVARTAQLPAGTLGILIWLACTAIYAVLYLRAHPTLIQFQSMWFLPEEFFIYWSNGNGVSLGWLDRVPVLMMTMFVLASSWLIGSAILARLRIRQQLNTAESLSLATTLGLHTVSLYTLATGLLGLLSWLTFTGPLLCIIAAAGWYVFKSANSQPSSSEAKQGQEIGDVSNADRIRFHRIAIGLAIPFLIAYVLGGMNPPRDFDVREYHLQAPKEWFQNGSIGFLPHNVYANMPMGSELPALASMAMWPTNDAWWQGAIVGKTVLASYALLTWLLLIGIGTRLGSALAGSFAGLTYVTVPLVGVVSLSGLADAAVAHFTLAAVFLTWMWHTGSPAQRKQWLILAAAFTGGAMSCKYPTVVMLFIPLLIFIAVSAIRRNSRADESDTNPESAPTGQWNVVSTAFVFLGIALASCSPWYVKNLVATGNPVYPLARTVLPSPDSNELVERWDRAHQVPRDVNGNAYSLSQFKSSLHDILLSNRQQSMLLWPLFIAGLIGIRRRDKVQWLAIYIAIYILLWWLFTHRIDRFWLPVVPLAALIAGLAIDQWDTRGWRATVTVLFILYSLALFPLINFSWGDMRVFTSLAELRVDTESQFLSARVNAVHKHLNDSIADVSTVLLVGDAQPFDLTSPTIYNTCFNDCQMELIAKDADDAEIKSRLHKKNISHVYVNWLELHRYRSAGNYGYSSFVTPEFISHLEEVGTLRRIFVPGVEPKYGELFEVLD